MGTTASTKNPTARTPTPASSRSLAGERSPTRGSVDQAEAGTEERKERLKRKLRSKIRAIALFRKSVRLASVSGSESEAEEEEEEEEEGEERGGLHSLDILYHPSNKRQDLREFLWKRKQETEACWDSIREDEEKDVREKFSIHDRKTDGASGRPGHVRGRGERVPEELRRPPPMSAVENEGSCDVCGQLAVFSAPCRICPRVFHRKCLERSGRYKEDDGKMMERAVTREGWSCYNCDNLCLLLTAAETADMMEEFDNYDINRDESISVDEFVRFKKRQYRLLDGDDMPEDEEQLVRAQFDRMDADHSGEVDWWEFMRFEARRFLARKSEDELVAMLTAKELLEVRSVYSGFLAGREPEYTYLQGVFLGSGIETWQEFLRDQALYILWSRPNRDHSLVI